MLPTSPRLHTEPKLRERQRSSKIRGDLKACSAVTCYQLSAVVAWCCNSCALEHLLHVAHVSTSIDCSNIFQYSSWGQILLFSSQSGGSQASEGATPFSTKSKVVFWESGEPPRPPAKDLPNPFISFHIQNSLSVAAGDTWTLALRELPPYCHHDYDDHGQNMAKRHRKHHCQSPPTTCFLWAPHAAIFTAWLLACSSCILAEHDGLGLLDYISWFSWSWS